MQVTNNSISLDQNDLNNKETMDNVQKMLNAQQDAWVKDIQSIAENLNVSDAFATSIWYLRTRSRWTQELENRLIEMSKQGFDCPNMNEWP